MKHTHKKPLNNSPNNSNNQTLKKTPTKQNKNKENPHKKPRRLMQQQLCIHLNITCLASRKRRYRWVIEERSRYTWLFIITHTALQWIATIFLKPKYILLRPDLSQIKPGKKLHMNYAYTMNNNTAIHIDIKQTSTNHASKHNQWNTSYQRMICQNR